jgi:hypothetical protein
MPARAKTCSASRALKARNNEVSRSKKRSLRSRGTRGVDTSRHRCAKTRSYLSQSRRARGSRSLSAVHPPAGFVYESAFGVLARVGRPELGSASGAPGSDATRVGSSVSRGAKKLWSGVTAIVIFRFKPIASLAGPSRCSTNRSKPFFSSQISTTRNPKSVGAVRCR